MEQECVLWLKQYMECECVTERLRTVRPQVKVSSHRSDGITKLHCLVYGFYPQTVVVKWMRNRRDVVLSDEVNKVLPNPDGTYQTRVTIAMEGPAGEEERYSCSVDHSSLEEILYVTLEPKTIGKSWHIGIVFAIFVISIALFVIQWKSN
ncbi:hereditary hemochromatosis protein homolog [Pseudophryne corroboree]|uniref:hereditary hemochromatosis protein homolog n=1 Tax=Pseudophryne corroboree TaxID=495146 RepID=UPI003081202C